LLREAVIETRGQAVVDSGALLAWVCFVGREELGSDRLTGVSIRFSKMIGLNLRFSRFRFLVWKVRGTLGANILGRGIAGAES
jgi:hypothetical protein